MNCHASPQPGRRLYIIYNPIAGWRRRRRWEAVLAHLHRLGCSTTIAVTQRRGDAETLARSVASGSYDLVVVAGGDGTVNEVVNGLGSGTPPLGLIPLGTANVLAAEIGLSKRSQSIAEVLARCSPRSIYVGVANDRCFTMMVGVGFDARVIEQLNSRIKHFLGKLAYVISSLKCTIRIDRSHYEVEIEGRSFNAASVIIAKGHYYGGRFVVAKHARIDDPRVHVAIFERQGRWNILRYATAIALGRISHLSDIKILESTEVKVAGSKGESVQADGDLASTLPLLVKIRPNPLSLVMPNPCDDPPRPPTRRVNFINRETNVVNSGVIHTPPFTEHR